MLASLVSFGLVLAAGSSGAQEPGRPTPLPSVSWQAVVPDVSGGRPPAASATPASSGPGTTLIFHKPSVPEPNAIRLTAFHAAPALPPAETKIPGLEAMDVEIQLEPPSFYRFIRLESEEAMRERIRQERRDKQSPQRAIFPYEPPATEEPYQAAGLSAPDEICGAQLRHL